jgi:hypothetical protein
MMTDNFEPISAIFVLVDETLRLSSRRFPWRELLESRDTNESGILDFSTVPTRHFQVSSQPPWLPWLAHLSSWLEPLLSRLFDVRFQPSCGSRHGSISGVIHNKTRKCSGNLNLAQQVDACVFLSEKGIERI